MHNAKSLSMIYIQGGEELLDRARPLWVLLNRHHRDLATQNKENYDQMSFDMRIDMVRRQAAPGKIMVLLACSPEEQTKAYCISLVDQSGRGEIASIFVNEECRGHGIGHSLIGRALDWMLKEGAQDAMVTVLPENDRAINFYSSFGFYQRLILMLKPGLAP